MVTYQGAYGGVLIFMPRKQPDDDTANAKTSNKRLAIIYSFYSFLFFLQSFETARFGDTIIYFAILRCCYILRFGAMYYAACSLCKIFFLSRYVNFYLPIDRRTNPTNKENFTREKGNLYETT